MQSQFYEYGPRIRESRTHRRLFLMNLNDITLHAISLKIFEKKKQLGVCTVPIRHLLMIEEDEKCTTYAILEPELLSLFVCKGIIQKTFLSTMRLLDVLCYDNYLPFLFSLQAHLRK